ncbi:MAG: poly(3-hydroxybutyrate) depolymerase [Betaproteobacteria bacterium]|nr:poly(3-hydroxybutyrate) depolymerase [Betaproteobacteria bacterium]
MRSLLSPSAQHPVNKRETKTTGRLLTDRVCASATPRKVIARLFAAALALFAAQHSTAALPLPSLGALPGELTVSGLSSGGFMAVQFQIAHSQAIKGAGVLAGGPYYCAEGNIGRALENCMAPSDKSPLPTTERKMEILSKAATAGKIDAPANLLNHRVWLFSGGNDRTVAPSVMDSLHDFYRKLLPASAVRYSKVPDAGHAILSIADKNANACATSAPPFINRCQDMDVAGELLAHLIGPLNGRGSALAGELVTFDQRSFISGKAVDASLADEGYVYVPKSCRTGGCRVHLVLHGCRQSSGEIGRRFAEGSGYNEWADSNRLIVLYPQTIARSGPALGSWKVVFNPKSCWDWWGYTGADYHTRDGVQIKALKAMVDHLQAPSSR